MESIRLPFGKTAFELNPESVKIMSVVRANAPDEPKLSPEEAVREALDNPIASPGLSGVLKAGEKICLIVPDITRVWESTSVSTPILLNALNKCGIRDEDITILCACGTHRPMTGAEHETLLGKETLARVKVVDHRCEDTTQLKYMGETSRKTPVYFNRLACEADKIVTSCGIVYHFFAGFGGGAKMLLPGISGSETIMRNHNLALNPGLGSGENPQARAGNISSSNPVHADMVEAAEFLPPAFALNVVVDDKFQIIRAFAGEWRKSHIEGCRLVGEMDGVKIPRMSDFVIASAGGYPKDINLYQGIKLLSNAKAASPGGVLLLLGQFAESFGNEDCARQIRDFKDMKSREEALRDRFSIGSYAGFLFAEACVKYQVVLVTDMPADLFVNTGAAVFKTLEEALAHVQTRLKPRDAAIVMPHGATTLPIPAK